MCSFVKIHNTCHGRENWFSLNLLHTTFTNHDWRSKRTGKAIVDPAIIFKIVYGYCSLLIFSTFFLIPGSMLSINVLALLFNTGLRSNNLVTVGESL